MFIASDLENDPEPIHGRQDVSLLTELRICTLGQFYKHCAAERLAVCRRLVAN